MKHRTDAIVKCPYYKWEDSHEIVCEGVKKETGTLIHLTFDTSKHIKDYKGEFCKGCYNKCLIADAQNRKWGYDHDNPELL